MTVLCSTSSIKRVDIHCQVTPEERVTPWKKVKAKFFSDVE